ncbi:MAG: asparagine synthase (glutamine-hydrolyzing) [Pseudomonadota bacterium]
MCGIAGIVTQDVSRYQSALDGMVAALNHRGPDGHGKLLFQNCGLGHTRLAIIDLATGQQPMPSSDRSVAVTFNGEIYGFRDIRRNLKEYPFQTTSDTEVILALYDRYGDTMMSHLPGMFAFAIWDDKRQQLLCGRDRFGEKPLYYAQTPDDTFVFASEIKAILASGLIAPEIDQAGLVRYLRRGYPYSDGSIYRNIQAVPPAHMLILREGKVSIQPYWQLPPTETRYSLSEAAERFHHLFDQAVSRQLVSDVPVGAFLSGGLDSTTVVCSASRVKPDLKTFSFDFLGSHSEIEFARTVAAARSTDHVELSADAVPVADLLLKMQDVYDEPFYDSSNIATYLLCELASKHTKVALTGDGADELLGGYPWYQYYPTTAGRHDHLFLRWTAARIMARAARILQTKSAHRLETRNIRLQLQYRYPSALTAHQNTMSIICDRELLSFGITPQPSRHYVSADCAESPADAALRDDVTDYMPSDILIKTDRAAMAHGLELRAPFLDTELAQFCISLPASFKISDSSDKILLRTAFAQEWPASIRNRQKQGFGAPILSWLARDDMKALAATLLYSSNSRLYDFLDYNGTRNFLSKSSDIQTWQLINLAAWLQRH